ncbi:hypothetical protein GCM10025880_01220 [Methylorubrum aminovorans]|uniref:hypothetical protein n=1 Tax=Methylorubrum aminovorans TaxID=269069 RepID=UPI0023E99535|nr:hypothetical protein [Methylorubrum aminovorans]GMA73617.1 hypothetical protein GCM10025880_00340 [Methylorubrum aminovorans]GMA73705.1 hypothetical protein GCM10025880_01220 [Methylorubrum aminovorans]
MSKRIHLCNGYHAEPGETPGHLHDVYATIPPLGGNKRVHVGTLSKAAVEAWAALDTERVGLLGRLNVHRASPLRLRLKGNRRASRERQG